CGDVEQACWGDVRAQLQCTHFFADAVKVSHHGSETGYVAGLWEDLAGGKKPIAVIAPYLRFRLPKPEGLRHLPPHVAKILLTCPIDIAITPGRVTQPLKSRMFLRARLRARPAPLGAECGRCTLVYDASGNCIREECVAPAHELKTKNKLED